MQTVSTLIRRRLMWRLIWINTVYECPFHETLGINGLNREEFYFYANIYEKNRRNAIIIIDILSFRFLTFTDLLVDSADDMLMFLFLCVCVFSFIFSRKNRLGENTL